MDTYTFIIIAVLLSLPLSYIVKDFLSKKFGVLKEYHNKLLDICKQPVIILFRRFRKEWENINTASFFSEILLASILSIGCCLLWILSAIILYIGIFLILPSEFSITIPKLNIRVGFAPGLAALFISFMEGVLGLLLFHGDNEDIVSKRKFNELRRERPIWFWSLLILSIVEGSLGAMRGGIYAIEPTSPSPWLLPIILPSLTAFLLLFIGIVTPLVLAVVAHLVRIYFKIYNWGLVLHTIFWLIFILATIIILGIPFVIHFVFIMIPAWLVLFIVEFLSEVWEGLLKKKWWIKGKIL